jgi:hypothetical protein
VEGQAPAMQDTPTYIRYSVGHWDEIDDPMNYTRPWVVKQILNWRADYLVLAQHDCEETVGQPAEAVKYGYSPPQNGPRQEQS